MLEEWVGPSSPARSILVPVMAGPSCFQPLQSGHIWPMATSYSLCSANRYLLIHSFVHPFRAIYGVPALARHGGSRGLPGGGDSGLK